MKTLLLGLCIYFCPPLFSKLGERWFPSEFSGDSGAERTRATGNMRRRFWRGFALVVATIGAVLFVQWVRSALIFGVADWLRVLAVAAALTTVLGRGGWDIQTWDGNTVNERIDRGMYVVGQLGAAALLIFVLSL